MPWRRKVSRRFDGLGLLGYNTGSSRVLAGRRDVSAASETSRAVKTDSGTLPEPPVTAIPGSAGQIGEARRGERVLREEALSDLNIVEYAAPGARSVAGSFCAKLLADLGADVIKVERPPLGDPARRAGPFPGDEPHPERSGLFLYLNTSKRGMTLDPETQMGADAFRELVKKADILVENAPHPGMEKLGLGYESLSALNPGLIMTSVTPFGRFGPHAGYEGNDLVCCHMSGLAYHTPLGGVEDPSADPPLKPGGRQSDFVAGSTAATATMCAAIHRRATGAGQHVDVSQQESIACFLRHQVSYYSYDPEGEYRTRYGDRQKGQIRGLGYMPCLDGYIVNGSREGHQWRALLEMVSGDEWRKHEELQDALSGDFNLFAFAEKIGDFRPVILEWMMQRTKAQITSLAQQRRIPIVPCNSAEDMYRSPHLAERGSFVEIEHPKAGRFAYPGAPYRFSETPWRIHNPAPLLGEHNEEILCGRLGYSRRGLARLRESGSI